MPGPLPKPDHLRQRKNRSASRAILPAEAAPIAKPPPLPKHPGGGTWHAMTRTWWGEVWASPMVGQYLQVDVNALIRLAVLVDKFWTAPTPSLAGEIRMQEAAFGLTPVSRRRLEWTIVKTEEAGQGVEWRRARAARVIEHDPRAALGEE